MASRSAVQCCGFLAAVVCTAIGCGDSSKKVPVRGNVTYQGQTLENGSITFFPTAGRPAFAALTAEGDYSIELDPGDYTVTVENSATLPPSFKEGDPPPPPPKIVVPPEYTSRARSTLKATVAADQSEPISFDLK
jgi:hypothetical protein